MTTALNPIPLKKLTGNKPLSAAVKIAAVLTADLLLRSFLPFDFLEIDIRNFADKIYHNETLSLPQFFLMLWNQNIRSLAILFFIVVTALLFHFRFKKAEICQLSRHTAIIALACFAMSAIGYSYLMYYTYSHYGYMWQLGIAEVLRVIFSVALCEEVLHRGYITNELFRLRSNRLKTPVAIAISAVIFGFGHIDGFVISFLFRGIPPSFLFSAEALLSYADAFFFPAICGVSWAVVLYYKKDIISLICIHAAHNLLFSAYWDSGKPLLIGALYMVFYISFIICYPAFLIYKARKKPEALNSV